jgi:hypothetical protein
MSDLWVTESDHISRDDRRLEDRGTKVAMNTTSCENVGLINCCNFAALVNTINAYTIQGVSGGIVNILGGSSMDFSE